MTEEASVKPKNKAIHGATLLLAGAAICAVGISVGQFLIGGDTPVAAGNHSSGRDRTRGGGEIPVGPPFEENDPLAAEVPLLESDDDLIAGFSRDNEGSETSADRDRAGITSHIALADEELRAGNYSQALSIYEFALEQLDGVSEAAVRYRIALCAEVEGRFAEASKQYQSLARQFSTLTWAGIARLGEARCLAALGNVEALSVGLMRQVILDETYFSPQVRGELLHVTGRAYCQAFVPDDVTYLMHDSGMVMPVCAPDPDMQLEMIDELLSETSPDHANTVAFEILQRTDNLPDSIFLKAHTPASNLIKVLEAVCKRSGFTCNISEAAEIVLSGRTQQLHNDDIRLSLLFDGLCTPFGLTWTHHDGEIRVRASSEMDADSLAEYRRAAGKRLLRNALIAAPDSYHASFSRVSLGILQFQEHMFVDAAHSFQVQIQLDSRSEVQAETSFNLGKCLLAMGQIDDSRVAFLQAVDASSNNLDATVGGYLYVGRLQLEQGESSGAVSTLVRALAVSRGTNLEPPAALMLSSAYLMDGKPQGANAILMERRGKLQRSEHRTAAAFLSALARFKAALLPARREREGRDLVTALTRFKPKTQFGAHWSFLHAEACLELGLTDMAVESYLQTIKRVPAASLRERAMLSVAHLYRLDGRLDEAKELLAALELDHSDSLGQKISLQAALVALQQGNPTAAVRHCRHVVITSDDMEVQRTALQTMGRAYQQQKNHQAAVYCFAGMLPAEQMMESDATTDLSDRALQSESPSEAIEKVRALQPFQPDSGAVSAEETNE